MFPPALVEVIGYYVYALADRNELFYIGKGVGNRAFAHAAAELALADDETPDSAKLQRIRDIRASGRTVEVLILRRELKTEAEAFRLESLLIDLFNGGYQFDLKNLTGGYHASAEGIMSADEVIAAFEAPPIQLDDTPVLMIRIPRLWKRGMQGDALLDAVRGWWRLDPQRARRAKYVLAVSKGVVREVFVPDPDSWRARVRGEAGWTESESTRARYGFEGRVAGDRVAWRNKSVDEYFKPGSQTPFRYHGC